MNYKEAIENAKLAVETFDDGLQWVEDSIFTMYYVESDPIASKISLSDIKERFEKIEKLKKRLNELKKSNQEVYDSMTIVNEIYRFGEDVEGEKLKKND